MRLRKFIAAITFFICGIASAGQLTLPLDACQVEAPFGFPSTRKTDSPMVCRLGYVLQFDNKAKIPMWVSYVLRPEHVVGCGLRDNTFEADQSLTTSATLKDYAKSGYDIGHMANAADFRWDPIAQANVAILSNAVPQLPEFNRGVWKRLEDATRGWVISRNSPIQVITGTIYNRKKSKQIGTGVLVPDAFFKVLVDLNTLEVQAFILVHEGSKAELTTFRSTIAEVQKRANIKIPLPVGYKQATWEITIKNAVQARKNACNKGE